MTLKELCRKAHKQACDKGFWVTDSDGNTIQNRNKSELLMLVVSELGEACEALRLNNRQVAHSYKWFKTNKEWRKDTFEDELADAVIRIADLCESEGIDLDWQIKQKMKYNNSRPIKHGKEF